MHIGEEIPNPYSLGINGLGESQNIGGPIMWGALFGALGWISGPKKGAEFRAAKWAGIAALASYGGQLLMKGK